MNHGTIVQAAQAEHPESGRDLLRLTVDQPYDVGGQSYPYTDIWGPLSIDPRPEYGYPVSWDHHSIWLGAKVYKKVENDSRPDEELH